tara:strand:+ start:275 stop:466 length:192 start_codon:yes stop_codon:yes gene_type:complete
MADKVKYKTDSRGVKVKITFDEENKVWRSKSPEFDQKPLFPKRKGSGAELRGGGRAFNRGGKV